MGVLNHLIAPKRTSRAKRAAYPAELSNSLASLLSTQLDRLGVAAGAVADTGPCGSAWSRAYILGAACASLQQSSTAPVSDRACFVTAITAFAFVYGDGEARAILAATIAAAEAKEPEVEDGLLQGASDLALVAMGGDGATLAFAARNALEMDVI